MLMTNKNKNIPNGTRDLLFEEAKIYRELTDALTELYGRNGFSEIVTPGVEYYDVFKTCSALAEERMYKLSDLDGSLLVLRADNTTPIARVAATRLSSDGLYKLFYHQRVYRQNAGHTGRRSEIFQSGIEMLGASGVHSDLLCMIYALKTLDTFGVDNKLEIGHVGYYNALTRELELDAEQSDKLRRLVEAKDTNKITASDKIKEIPFLFGGEEVFSRAEALADGNTEALSALAYLKQLYDALCRAGYKDRIMIDLGIVHTLDYYTGAVFRGYMEGAGECVLTGGRYDRLVANFDRELPATGFGINLSTVADTLLRSGQRDVGKNKTLSELVVFECEALGAAIAYCDAHPESELSPYGDITDAEGYAEKLGIKLIKLFMGNGDIQCFEL